MENNTRKGRPETNRQHRSAQAYGGRGHTKCRGEETRWKDGRQEENAKTFFDSLLPNAVSLVPVHLTTPKNGETTKKNTRKTAKDNRETTESPFVGG